MGSNRNGLSLLEQKFSPHQEFSQISRLTQKPMQFYHWTHMGWPAFSYFLRFPSLQTVELIWIGILFSQFSQDFWLKNHEAYMNWSSFFTFSQIFFDFPAHKNHEALPWSFYESVSFLNFPSISQFTDHGASMSRSAFLNFPKILANFSYFSAQLVWSQPHCEFVYLSRPLA